MSRVRRTEVEGTYLRKGDYLRGLPWEVVEGLTDLGERILPGPGVPEEKVLPGRAAPTEGRAGRRREEAERRTWARRAASGSWVPTCLWYTRTRGLSSFSRVSR